LWAGARLIVALFDDGFSRPVLHRIFLIGHGAAHLNGVYDQLIRALFRKLERVLHHRRVALRNRRFLIVPWRLLGRLRMNVEQKPIHLDMVNIGRGAVLLA
jgi:hypothetical protein